MTELTRLQPSRIWTYFAQICQIPHPSKQEQALREWILQLAKAHRCETKQDQKGNLLIRKKATEGCEAAPVTILQAHLDMVCQANKATLHDFTTDPIQPYIDGNWVKAKGTTLGADNGIGLASCLAILTDPSIKHGPLEILLTVDEEAGMGGAFALQPGWLTGRYLINTDAEQDDEIFVGCAGGLEARIEYTLNYDQLPQGYQCYQIKMSGLKGGHSGLDIHKNRANAIKLLSRTLIRIQQSLNFRLVHISGGNLRNAIPREAEATIAIPVTEHHQLMLLCETELLVLRKEHQLTEPNLEFNTESTKESPTKTFDQQTTLAVLRLLQLHPNGVSRMSPVMPNVVETSSNLGIVKQEGNVLVAINFVRSLTDEGRADLRTHFSALAESLSSKVIFNGDYSGWSPAPDSLITQIATETYTALFNQQPKQTVIHAGLECGLFKKYYPELDMVSIGPTIENAHSPDERVSITSVQRYWQLLTKMLYQITQQ